MILYLLHHKNRRTSRTLQKVNTGRVYQVLGNGNVRVQANVPVFTPWKQQVTQALKWTIRKARMTTASRGRWDQPPCLLPTLHLIDDKDPNYFLSASGSSSTMIPSFKLNLGLCCALWKRKRKHGRLEPEGGLSCEAFMVESSAFLSVCHILLNQSGQQFARSDSVIMLAEHRESISALMLWFIGGSITSPGFPAKISQKLDLMIHDGLRDLNIFEVVTKWPLCVHSGDNPWHPSTAEVVLCRVPSAPVMQDFGLTCGSLLLKWVWTSTDPVLCSNLCRTDH